MKVPTKSYPVQYRRLWPEVQEALETCVFSDDPILGQALGRFELALARFHQVSQAIEVGSGTDALVLTRFINRVEFSRAV